MMLLYSVLGAFYVPLLLAAAFPSIVESRENQVVGGEPASVKDFPYIVSLSRQSSGHFCCGSLINERTVVTAAHCIADKEASLVTIRAGSIFTNSGGVVAGAARLIPHPRYDALNSNYDIAIIKLSEPIAAQGDIAYASLPAAGLELAAGAKAKAAGW